MFCHVLSNTVYGPFIECHHEKSSSAYGQTYVRKNINQFLILKYGNVYIFIITIFPLQFKSYMKYSKSTLRVTKSKIRQSNSQ